LIFDVVAPFRIISSDEVREHWDRRVSCKNITLDKKALTETQHFGSLKILLTSRQPEPLAGELENSRPISAAFEGRFRLHDGSPGLSGLMRLALRAFHPPEDRKWVHHFHAPESVRDYGR
jgi:hypothetical protein